MNTHREPLKIDDAFIGFVSVGVTTNYSSKTGRNLLELEEIYKRIFPKNSFFKGVKEIYDNSTQFKWTISNGRKIISEAFLHEIELPYGYKGLVGYSDVKEQLTVDEVIEMICLLRGSHERIDQNNRNTEIIISHSGSEEPLRQLLGTYLKEEVSYIIPVLYVKQFTPRIETGEGIISLYAAELIAIKNLAIQQADLLKPSYINYCITNDAHPFIYGVTLFSPICTIEFHPTSTIIAAEREGITIAQHHTQEWVFLTGLLLVSTLHRVAMELDSGQLDILLSTPRTSNLLKELSTIRLFSKCRRTIARRLDIYLNVQLTRREYMNEILENARLAFALDKLYENVRIKLADLSDDINSMYNAYMTAAMFILSVVATVFTVITIFQNGR